MIGEKFFMAVWRLVPELAICCVAMSIKDLMMSQGLLRLLPEFASIFVVERILRMRGYCPNDGERALLSVTLNLCMLIPSGYLTFQLYQPVFVNYRTLDDFIWALGMEFAAIWMWLNLVGIGLFLWFYFTGRLAKPSSKA